MKVHELITALSDMPALADVAVPTDDDHPPVPVLGVGWFDSQSPVLIVLDMEAW